MHLYCCETAFLYAQCEAYSENCPILGERYFAQSLRVGLQSLLDISLDEFFQLRERSGKRHGQFAQYTAHSLAADEYRIFHHIRLQLV